MSRLREWSWAGPVATPGDEAHPKVRRRETRWALSLLGSASGSVALLLALGALGALHPAADSLAVFRGAFSGLGLAIAALLAILGARRGALAAAALPTIALMSLVPHWTAGTPGADLALYQKNLHYTLRDPGRIRDDILAARPDIVTFEELHANNDAIMTELADAYPFQLRCTAHRYVGDVAVLSRYPFRAGSANCPSVPGMASVVVETPKGPVTVAAIHLFWPWPHEQPEQVVDLLREIAALEGPVVIAGDFNMVRWSETLRRFARASGTGFVGHAAMSYRLGPGPFTGVAIDHVLAPGGQGSTEFRPQLGSDHRGVLARIALPE